MRTETRPLAINSAYIIVLERTILLICVVRVTITEGKYRLTELDKLKSARRRVIINAVILSRKDNNSKVRIIGYPTQNDSS